MDGVSFYKDMDGRMDGWTDRYVDRGIDGKMDGWTDRQMDKWINKQMDRRMDIWTKEGMEG
jgi:hypothetical protein